MSNEREIGELTEAIKNLTKKLDEFEHELESMKGTLNTGKGVMIGLLLAAGGLGATISDLLR